MKLKLSPHDTGYIEFSEEKAEESISIPDTGLVLDFNDKMQLIGIETIQASKDLPKNLLDQDEASKDE